MLRECWKQADVADPSSPVRVALVDDQPLFRAGIRMVVESQVDLQLAWEADNGARAVELAAEQATDDHRADHF